MKLIISLICTIVFVVIPGFDLLGNLKKRPALTSLAVMLEAATGLEDVNTTFIQKPQNSNSLDKTEERLSTSELQRMKQANALLVEEEQKNAEKLLRLEQQDTAQANEIATLKQQLQIARQNQKADTVQTLQSDNDKIAHEDFIKVQNIPRRFTTTAYETPAVDTRAVTDTKKESVFSRSPTYWN